MSETGTPADVRGSSSCYRLRHYGRNPLTIHAATRVGWDTWRTLCGAHEGRGGYEIQLGPPRPVTCKRCLRAMLSPKPAEETA